MPFRAPDTTSRYRLKMQHKLFHMIFQWFQKTSRVQWKKLNTRELQFDSPNPSIPPPKKLEGNYTQINVLFPSSQVELPSAEKFNAFPPDAQKAILGAFQTEQAERHTWLKNQQGNEHLLNMQTGRHYFRWRITGTIGGVIVLLAALGFGTILVLNKASAVGVFLMLTAVGGMIGAAIFGRTPTEKPKDDKPAAPTDPKP
jgi:hypothetical protein